MWWRVATLEPPCFMLVCIIRIHIRFLVFSFSKSLRGRTSQNGMHVLFALVTRRSLNSSNMLWIHQSKDSLKTFDAAAPDHGSIADDSRGLRAGELWFDPSSPTKSADPHAGCMVGVCAPSASGR